MRKMATPRCPRGKTKVFKTRILVFLLLGVALFIQPKAKILNEPRSRLNLLLITVDTLRADRLSCYGAKHLQTNNIDSLAARGTLFTRAFAHSVTTLPSHANILLGNTPAYHGVHDNANFVVREELLTLAEHLKKVGYSTGAFVGAFPLDARFGLSQGFDFYDDKYTQPGSKEAAKERKAEAVIESALAWLNRKPKEPWFLWMHLWDPHDPYDPPEPFKTRYADSLYDGEVAYVDFALGKVFRFVEEQGLFSRTMIILTGDHGESLGEHGEKTHGFLAYNTTTWVPLLIFVPGSKPGRVDQNVCHIDIFPTICDVLQIESPLSVQGITLRPALQGKSLRPRPIYFESLSPYYSFGWAPIRGFVEGEEKFIDSPIPELFNLREDFRELHNLMEKKGVESYRKRLARILSTHGHPSGILAERRMDRETLEKLRSLGYVQSARETTKESFGPEDDVKTLLPFYNRAAEALEISKQGRVKEAMATLKEIITQNKFIPHAYTNLALLYKEIGRLEDGLEVLKMAFGHMPENYDIFSGLIAFLMEDGQDDAILEALQAYRFREMDYDPVIWNYAGLAHWHKGNGEEARRCWERSVEIDPKFSMAYGNLGTFYHSVFRETKDEKAFEQGVKLLKKTLELDPYDGKAMNALGLLYLEAGAHQEAIDTLEEAWRIQPDFFDILYNLGMAYMKAGNFPSALKYFEAFMASPAFESLEPGEKEDLKKRILTCRRNSRPKNSPP